MARNLTFDHVLLVVLLVESSVFVAAFWVGCPVWSGSWEQGDYSYYVQSTTNPLPLQDHPIVPAMLRATNLLLQNPIVTVKLFMVFGYVFTYLLIYRVVWRVTGSTQFAVGAFTSSLACTHCMVTPTALKNLWAIVFTLAALLVIVSAERRGWTMRRSAIVAGVSLVVALSHSIPIFMLAAVLLAYVLHHVVHGGLRQHRTTLLLAPAIAGLVAVTLLTKFRAIDKLAYNWAAFTQTPIAILSYNVSRLLFTYIMIPFFLLYLIAIVTTLRLAKRRQPHPLLTGLAAGVSLLFFTGHEWYVGRFYVTAIPFLLVFLWAALGLILRDVPVLVTP